MNSDVDDGFGPDLVGDAADRARLAAMAEVDREMVIFERGEARRVEVQRRRTLREAARARGLLPADGGGAARAVGRPAGSKRAAIEDLVAKKQASKKKAERRAVGDDEGDEEAAAAVSDDDRAASLARVIEAEALVSPAMASSSARAVPGAMASAAARASAPAVAMRMPIFLVSIFFILLGSVSDVPFRGALCTRVHCWEQQCSCQLLQLPATN